MNLNEYNNEVIKPFLCSSNLSSLNPPNLRKEKAVTAEW